MQTGAMGGQGLLMLVLYALSSSSLLVFNKGAVMLIPKPAMLLMLQTSASVAITVALWTVRLIYLEKQKRETLKGYAMVSLLFISTIYANMKVLQFAGVNLFIVLRCSTPILVAILDFVFLGRQLPDRRSLGALLGLACSGASYAYLRASSQDSYAVIESTSLLMFWCCVWVLAFVVDMIFIKHIVDKTGVSGWAGTLLQNGFASMWLGVILLIDILFSTDAVYIASETWDFKSLLVVGASCVIGTVLSFSGLTLRGLISATSFTIVGVACKMLSILLNEITIGEDKGSLVRLFSVIACIGFSALYKQAPMRQTNSKPGSEQSKV